VKIISALAGAVLARLALPAAASGPQSTNYRGRRVSLAGGPALGVAASLSAAAGAPTGLAGPALVAGLAATAVGRYDDLAGARPEQAGVKGLRGHLRALLAGRLTAGTVKVLGLGGSALVAACLLPTQDPCLRPTARTGPVLASVRRGQGPLLPPRSARPRAASPMAVRPHGRTCPGWGIFEPSGARRRHRAGRVLDVALAAGVIAGTANLLNLLDLRPGRALKAGLLLGVPLAAGRGGGLAAGPVGAAAALLPDDLDERIMLGDSGANALGALLGLALAARTGRMGRAVALTGLAALNLAAERVSFSAVIDATPALRVVDRLGRRP
jgi:hypothetical protein